MLRRKGKKKAGESYLLLYHLLRTGIIPRSDLSLCRGGKKDQYAKRLIAKLIKEGQIETTRYRKCTCCYVSESAVESLRMEERDVYNHSDLLDDWQEFLALHKAQGTQNENSKPPYWEPGERRPTPPMNPQKRLKLERLEAGERADTFRSELRHGSAKNLMFSTGVLVYEEDKPDYETFLAILAHPNHKDTFLWYVLCKYGLYYSRSEMALDDNRYTGRMLGVLFTRAGWYVVYNTLDRFTRWRKKLEEDNMIILKKQMAGTILYRNVPPRSLVFAIGRGMVAAMVNGYKYGHNRTAHCPNNITKRWRKDIMTVEAMKDLYQDVYLVELNSSGIGSLAWLVLSDEKNIVAERQALVSGHPGLFRLAKTVSGQSIVVEQSSGREVMLSPICNLAELKRKRDGSAPVTYIGPPSMADTVSKSLGPKLGAYISAYGDGEIAVNRYDENGEKLSPQPS